MYLHFLFIIRLLAFSCLDHNCVIDERFHKLLVYTFLKSRPVLHHCVVIFVWSSGIMGCTCMLFMFENGVPLMRQGASVVWHHSLLLMNSFNKTKVAVISCKLCFQGDFPFISLIPTVTLWVARSCLQYLYICYLSTACTC